VLITYVYAGLEAVLIGYGSYAVLRERDLRASRDHLVEYHEELLELDREFPAAQVLDPEDHYWHAQRKHESAFRARGSHAGDDLSGLDGEFRALLEEMR